MLIRKKKIMAFCLLIFVSILPPSVSQAHKIRIFAYAEGKTIVGETAFSGGRVAKGAAITVQDAATARPLYSCQTDEQGQFRFQIPEDAWRDKLDLQIVVDVGEGHRGEWLLKAEEYLEGEGRESIVTGGHEDLAVSDPLMTRKQTVSVDEEHIRQVIEEVMDKKLGPVKRMLAQERNRSTDFRDILGGVGYLIGMAGIAAYINSKKKGVAK